MSQRSNQKQKRQAELREKGINPKGYGNWNQTIPEGYTFSFPKKDKVTVKVNNNIVNDIVQEPCEEKSA
jgi:hypothetical protein